MTWAMWALLLLAPEVVMPRPLELSSAGSDQVELERLATRLGPARLIKLASSAAASGQPRAAVAALRGLGLSGSLHPEAAAQGLLPLAELIGQLHDDKLLNAAVEALLRLCEGLQDTTVCAEPDDRGCGEDLDPLPKYLLQLAAQPTLSPAVRAQLVHAVRALPVPVWRTQAPRLVMLAQGTERGPEAVRDAALAALGLLAQHHLEQELVALALPPTPGELASAALAELCLPLPRKPVRPPAPPSPSLAPELAAQVRALSAADQPLPQRQRLQDCLRLLGTPQDKLLLQSIATAGRKPKR